MTESVDWDKLRHDFPVLRQFRYFLSASGGPMPLPVFKKTQEYFQDLVQYGDLHWEENLRRRESARRQVASLLNASPDEVDFVPSTGFGMNMLASILSSRGDVICNRLEFPSTTLPWLHVKPNSIRWVEPEADGSVPVSKLTQHMDSSTGIIATSYVQYSNGFRQDLFELGKAKRDHLLLVNATQAAGVFEIDVKKMKIDALCCNSYKWLLSGYGCGFIYVSREILRSTPPPLVGWFNVENRESFQIDTFQPVATAQRFSIGSPPFPNIFALGAGIEYLRSIGLDKIQERALELNRYLTTRLNAGGIEVLSPLVPEKYRSAQTLVRLDQPESTVQALREKGILCTLKPEGLRAATHFFVNRDDINFFVDSLLEITGKN